MGFPKNLGRSAITKNLARTIINPILNDLNLLCTDLAKVRTLGKIFTHQTVGMFVQTALTGAVRCGKVNLCTKLLRNLLMPGKLLAIVRRAGVHKMLIGLHALDQHLTQLISRLGLEQTQESVL